MKKSELRLIIKKIVREEVATAIKEVITELKKPTQQISKPKPQTQNYSKNKVLNDVLNETAQGEDWKQMGGDKFTSERMNELVGGGYGDMINGNSNVPVTVDGQSADFLKKDYRGLMKAIDKKQGK